MRNESVEVCNPSMEFGFNLKTFKLDIFYPLGFLRSEEVGEVVERGVGMDHIRTQNRLSAKAGVCQYSIKLLSGTADKWTTRRRFFRTPGFSHKKHFGVLWPRREAEEILGI